MKRTVVAVITALVLAAGCSQNHQDKPTGTAPKSSTPTPTATSTPHKSDDSSDDFIPIAPGLPGWPGYGIPGYPGSGF